MSLITTSFALQHKYLSLIVAYTNSFCVGILEHLILVVQVEAALTVLRVCHAEGQKKVCWAAADNIAMCVGKTYLLNWKDHPE